jgi:hypothetical protein
MKFKNLRLLVCCLSLLFATGVSAEEDKDLAHSRKKMKEELEAHFKKNQQMLEKMLNKDMMKSFDKHFEQMMKTFSEHGQKDFFNEEDMKSLMGKLLPSKDVMDKDVEWVKNPTGRSLLIHLVQGPDTPLNVEISKRKITIKGEVKRLEEVKTKNGVAMSQRIEIIEKVISIPFDLDEKSAKFESVDGKIKINFVFINQRKPSIPKSSPKIKKQKSGQKLEPLKKKKGDLEI